MSIVNEFENFIEKRVRALVVSPCLAKIVCVNGNLCDCEGIDMDDPDSRVVYPKLEIPILLGTKGGGIGGKPGVGSIVLLNFLNGDRSHPIISALIKGESSGDFSSLPKDKIKISSNGKDLGEMLVKFCDMISELQTTGSMGPSTMSPNQIFEWKLFVDKEIKGMFAVGGVGSGSENDNGENGEEDSLSEATKQAYLDIAFSDRELTELNTSGKYEIKSHDLLAIEEDYLLFWGRLEKHLGQGQRSETVLEICIADEFFIRKNKLPAFVGVRIVHVLHEDIIYASESTYDEEITILQKIAQRILGVEDVSLLVYNYAKHRVVYNEYQSVSSQKYSFERLKTLLENGNRESMKTIDLSFIELGISLAELGSEALNFSDEKGLAFLFDSEKKLGAVYKDGSGISTSLAKMQSKGESKERLADHTQQGLLTAATNAFYSLSQKDEKFKPVLINSGYRSQGWQAKYLVENKGTWRKYPTTEKLMTFCSDIFEGILTQEYVKDVRDGIIEDKALLDRINALHNEDALFDGGYIQRIQIGDTDLLITILEEIFTAGLYRPSEHPHGQAVDLSNTNSGKEIYNNHLGKKYMEGKFYHVAYFQST